MNKHNSKLLLGLALVALVLMIPETSIASTGTGGSLPYESCMSPG